MTRGGGGAVGRDRRWRPPARRCQRAAVVVGALAAAVSLTACGGSSAPAAVRRPVPPVSTSGAPPAVACRAADLTAELGTPVAEVQGQDQVALVFTDDTATACTMSGFPGVELDGPASGGSTTFSPPHQGIPPASVLLAPGSSAHAMVTYLTGADVCGAARLAWVPSRVTTVPPGGTTPIVLAWHDGPVDRCQHEVASAGTSVGPIEPGPAPTPPSPATVVAAQAAAQALYASYGPSTGPSWETAGVVTDGPALWLAVAAGRPPRAASVTVYEWSGGQWATRATVSLPDFGIVSGGVAAAQDAGDGVVALTGSTEPDFLVYGEGADSAFLSVVSDVGGAWHAVPFDVGPSPSPVAHVGTVTGNSISGAVDLCACAANTPEAFQWFRYASGMFRPANPPGAVPTCTAQQLAAAADQGSAIPVTFVSTSCDDGWALATGSEAGAQVVGLFNWQTRPGARWVDEKTASASALAGDPGAFTVPLDLLRQLARRIGVTVGTT